MQKRGRKAQAAMEFLMTYGWAILIVLIVLAALFFLGVFDPQTPNSCIIPAPFNCKDIVFREEGFEIILGAINIGGGTISDVKVNNQVCSKISVNGIQNGQPGSEIVNSENKIRCYGADIKIKDKVNTETNINYGSTLGTQHSIKLSGNGKVEKSSYASNFDDSKVLSLSFDEINNNLIKDLSFYNNDLTIINNANCNVQGKIGNGCSFDGIDDYLRRQNPNNLPLGNSPRTMEAWINPQGYRDGTYNGIITYSAIACYVG